MKLVKILLLNFILLFGLFSCNNQEKIDSSSVISTVSILENKTEVKKDNFCNQFIESWKYFSVWSDIKPKINKTHIFCWEYNKRWKATWFHAKIFWITPDTIIYFKIKDKKDKNWVYTANFELKTLDWWKNKTKFSSIFPDILTMEEVENAIRNAFNNNYKYSKKSWYFKWPSGLWFDISWYTYKNTGKINTAFPIYTK